MATFRLDMDMDMSSLREIFEQQNWEYAARGTYGLPDEDALAAQMVAIAQEMDEADSPYQHQGRIGLSRDPKIPGAYQVQLNLGYLYDEEVDSVAL